MKLLKFFGAAIAIAGFVTSASAEVPFNGLLLDKELKPKKGVKIYVKDPKRYAKSDSKGRFGLTDVQPDDTLTLMLSKKEILKVPVDGRRGIKIILAGDGTKSENDDEIADFGYGYVKRREYAGASSGISGDRLRATGAHDIIGALYGMVPGLEISGAGATRTVTIRGQKSLNLSSEPLYIVDGITVSSLNDVSIYDVDHVEVLKDANQYGSKGATGAIVVTTKAAGYGKK